MTKKRKANGQPNALRDTRRAERDDSERVAVFLKLTVEEWTRFAAVTKHMGWPTIQDAIRALVAAKVSHEKLGPAASGLGRRITDLGLKDAQHVITRELSQSASKASPWNQP